MGIEPGKGVGKAELSSGKREFPRGGNTKTARC